MDQAYGHMKSAVATTATRLRDLRGPFRRLMMRPIVRAVAVLPILLATFPLAIAIRYDAFPKTAALETLVVVGLLGGLLKFATFLVFGVFRIRTRHLSLEDLVVLAEATAFAGVAFALLATTAPLDFTLSKSVWVIDCILTGLVLSGGQLTRRVAADRRRSKGTNARRALIVAGEAAGETMLHAIRRDRRSDYQLVGLVSVPARSRGPLPFGTTIGGLPVVGTLDDACRVAAAMRVEELLVTTGDLSGKQLRSLVDEAAGSDLQVTVLPSYQQLLAGDVSMRPREVEIEDLLKREPIELDASRLTEWLKGRRVLVTGSSGSIGSEVCRQLLQFEPSRLILVDQAETPQFFTERELIGLRGTESPTELVPVIADIRDASRMESLFRSERPEIVFHAAAYKHVPLMESNGTEAIKVNVLGTKQLADLADRYEAESFVMVSTDKAVRPTSRMGATKRVAELYVQSLAVRSNCRFVTVRFGNVLGSNGSVVPIFRQQIARGGPVTVTHPDMTRFFMTIPEAAQLIIQAGGQGKGAEIFVLDMGEPVKVVDLARDMVRLSGLRVDEDIDIVFTGTRPGEKLFEELYSDGETRQPTEHAKILVAESEEINFFQVSRTIAELARDRDADAATLDAYIASLVPTYRVLTQKTGSLGSAAAPSLRVVDADGTAAAVAGEPSGTADGRDIDRDSDRQAA